MNYAVIAAGEGSRLAKEGFTLPKPMVTLNGEMMIERLINVFVNGEPDSIHIIINEESKVLENHLENTDYELPIQLVKKSTPSSLHSFYELLKAGELHEVCLTTTDTVFKEAEFHSYINAFRENPELDGLMAVTTFVDDESPLYVTVNEDFTITGFTDTNSTDTSYISGGIYCLRGKAIGTVFEAIEGGTSRMRNFQRQLLTNNLNLKAYPFSKIVDVDHVADIETAELFLRQEIDVETQS